MPRDRFGPRIFYALIVVLLLIIGHNVYQRYRGHALAVAVAQGDVAKVRLLLEKGVSPDTRIPFGPEVADGRPQQSALAWTLGHLRHSATPLQNTSLLYGTSNDGFPLDAPREQIACLLIARGAKLDPPTHYSNLSANTYLLQACLDGSLPVLQALLARGMKPDADCMHAALHYADASQLPTGQPGLAAEARYAERLPQRQAISSQLIQMLHAHGAELTLTEVVERGDMAPLQALLNKGIRADASPVISEMPPLEMAVSKGNVEMARLLLAHGADSNSALCTAAFQGRMELVKLLLAHGANVNLDRSTTPLDSAIISRHLEIARLLLAHGADVHDSPKPNANPQSMLASAITNLPQLVPELLRRGADVNGKQGDALRAALRSRNVPLVKELLRRGANVNPPSPRSSNRVPFTTAPTSATLQPLAPDSFLLNAACFAPECMEMLRHAGATWGPEKETILVSAAHAGRSDLFPRLLALGANINGADEVGETALTRAIVLAPDGVPFLIIHGADVNVIPRAQRTPLILAVFKGNVEMARLLLAQGANVNLRPPRGHTPLYWARKNSTVRTVPMMNQLNGTVKSQAIGHNNTEMVNLLLQAGASEEKE